MTRDNDGDPLRDFDPSDVERMFRGLTAGLPSEDALWRSGQLDAEVLAAMERCSTGRLPDTVPISAVAPAVIAECMRLDDLDGPGRNRRFKAIERHAQCLAGIARVARYDEDVLACEFGIDEVPGAVVRTVLYLDAADPPGWLAARVAGPLGGMRVVGRHRDDPWVAAALAAATELRRQPLPD